MTRKANIPQVIYIYIIKYLFSLVMIMVIGEILYPRNYYMGAKVLLPQENYYSDVFIEV